LQGLGHSVEEEGLGEKMAACEKSASEELGDAYTFFQMTQRLVKILDLPLGTEAAALLADAYAGPRYASWLFPGTHRVVKALHGAGIYLGIIANTAWTGFSMDRAFDGVGLLPYFSTLIYSGDIGMSKPDPRIFAQALRVSGRTAERILYVGNDLTADVKGASGVGWSTAFRTTKPEGSGGLADFDYQETEELLTYIDV